MLDMSRKNIEVTQNPYNKALVHLAGRLLGRALRTLPALQQRVDVMGFLLPGKANNPAVDELRRGLARELHLPVGQDTAEVATLTDYLTAIFPVTQPAWPELRYTQTLNFFAAGVPASMVNTEARTVHALHRSSIFFESNKRASCPSASRAA